MGSNGRNLMEDKSVKKLFNPVAFQNQDGRLKGKESFYATNYNTHDKDKFGYV